MSRSIISHNLYADAAQRSMHICAQYHTIQMFEHASSRVYPHKIALLYARSYKIPHGFPHAHGISLDIHRIIRSILSLLLSMIFFFALSSTSISFGGGDDVNDESSFLHTSRYSFEAQSQMRHIETFIQRVHE